MISLLNQLSEYLTRSDNTYLRMQTMIGKTGTKLEKQMTTVTVITGEVALDTASDYSSTF